MNSLALMTGIDIPIPELKAIIHQPSIRDISFIGETEYFSSLQLLCFNKEMLIAANPKGEVVLRSMNNFQIFMTLVGEKSTDNKQQKIIDLFKLFFPAYTVTFLPRSIFFNDPATKDNFTVDENNFDQLQQVLREISGINNLGSGQNSQYNPKGKRAAEIAAKLMKGRAKASGSADKQGSVFDRYVSILTIGLNTMSLDQCISLTVYQLYDLIERYGLYTAWDIDIKSRLAGGKPDEKPDDWMKPIH